MFKLRSDLATRSNDIVPLAMKIINKKGKNHVISAQYRQLYGGFKQYKTDLENFLSKMINSTKAIYLTGETNLILS